MNDKSWQNHDSASENKNLEDHRIQISIQDLSTCVLEHYQKLRNEQLPQLAETIPKQFIKIQKQIITIVQMRKDMEKVVQNDVIYSQHSHTILTLIQQNITLQKIIDSMAEVIKNLQNKNMEIYVKCLVEIQNKQFFKQSQIIQKGEKILMEFSDLKRQFHLDHQGGIFKPFPNQYCQNKCIKNDDFSNANLSELIIDQKQRQKVVKLIYECKMKELQLRDQLLQEQQKIFYEYQKSNSQLVETLLRQKEKDKNLRKKQNQKYIQLLKSKYQIDLQQQNMNYSDKLLGEDLFIELNKKKTQLKESKIQINNLQKQKDLLIKQNHILERKIKIQLQKYQKMIDNSAETWASKIRQNKINYEDSIKNSQIKFKEFQLQMQVYKKQNQDKINKLQQQKKHMEQKVTIVSQKLKKNDGQIKKKNEKLQQLSNQLVIVKENHKIQLQNQKKHDNDQIQLIKSTKYQLQAELNLLKNQNKQQIQLNQLKQSQNKQENNHLKVMIEKYEQKIDNLSTFLAQLQKQKKDLAIDKQQLMDNLQQMKKIVESLKSLCDQKQKQNDQNSLSKMYQQLRANLLQQLQKNKMIKMNMIDSFVSKIDQILL